MVTTFDGESAAIDSNAAAVVNEDVMRLSETKRRSGRRNQSAGSQRPRSSSLTVTAICVAGAICSARCNAFCSNVVGSPKPQYWTGDVPATPAIEDTYSGP